MIVEIDRWYRLAARDGRELRVAWICDEDGYAVFADNGTDYPDFVTGGDGSMVLLHQLVTGTWGEIDWDDTDPATLSALRNEPTRVYLARGDEPRRDVHQTLRAFA